MDKQATQWSMVKTVISLEYGDATLLFPDKMTDQDISDMEDILKLQIHSLRRQVYKPTISDTINEAGGNIQIQSDGE